MVRGARRGPPARGLTATPDAAIAAIARALGHPARVRLLRLLAQDAAWCCGDLVARLPLAQSTVSRHLGVLQRAGLIYATADGSRVVYRRDPGALRRLRELIAAL